MRRSAKIRTPYEGARIDETDLATPQRIALRGIVAAMRRNPLSITDGIEPRDRVYYDDLPNGTITVHFDTARWLIEPDGKARAVVRLRKV